MSVPNISNHQVALTIAEQRNVDKNIIIFHFVSITKEYTSVPEAFFFTSLTDIFNLFHSKPSWMTK